MVGQAPISDRGLLQVFMFVEPKDDRVENWFDGAGPSDDASVLVLVRRALCTRRCYPRPGVLVVGNH